MNQNSQQISTITEIQNYSSQLKSQKLSLAFVPTMGFLHDGHISLIKKAKSLADKVVVDIFINRAQFNSAADFTKYPVNLDNDIALLNKLQVDCIFTPNEQEVYPNGIPQIQIDYPLLTNKLCGAKRPGHFQGVLLIVHNLLQWIKPQYAVFGMKDYQQLLLIKKMVKDLAIDTTIIGSELIRAQSGLALSSRNERLSSEGLKKAELISKALFTAVEKSKTSDTSIHTLVMEIRNMLKPLEIEYASIYHPTTLVDLYEESPEAVAKDALVAVAAWVDGVRLIDNMLLKQGEQ